MAAKSLASAGIVLALSACAFEPLLTAKIVDYNRVAEDTGNSVLLLNVLRAKDRKPFYFTQVSSFSPGIRGSLGLDVTIPLSPTNFTSFTLNPSTSVQSNNDASVGVESAKEFAQGISRPISSATFDYYWQRGWPRAVLLNVFVQKIELVRLTLDKNKKEVRDLTQPITVYFNSPVGSMDTPDPNLLDCANNPYRPGQGAQQFACFQKLLRAVEPVVRVADRTESATEITPAVPGTSAQLKDWKALIEAAKSGFELRESKGLYQIVKTGESKRLCIVDPDLEPDISSHRRSSRFECLRKDAAPQKRLGAPFQSRYAAVARRKNLGPELVEAYDRLNQFCRSGVGCELHFHLRSPEAMIYYLGEIVRAQSVSNGSFNVFVFDRFYAGERKIPPQCTEHEAGRYFMSLFKMHQGPLPPLGAAASVRYEGKVHYIPQGGCQVSTEVMTLLQQVFALQRDSKELPAPTTLIAR